MPNNQDVIQNTAGAVQQVTNVTFAEQLGEMATKELQLIEEVEAAKAIKGPAKVALTAALIKLLYDKQRANTSRNI